MEGTNFSVLSSTPNWVDGVKFIARVTLPDILPFFKTKLGDARNKVIRWEFIFVMDKDRADVAAMSAFSLPGMFT